MARAGMFHARRRPLVLSAGRGPGAPPPKPHLAQLDDLVGDRQPGVLEVEARRVRRVLAPGGGEGMTAAVRRGSFRTKTRRSCRKGRRPCKARHHPDPDKEASPPSPPAASRLDPVVHRGLRRRQRALDDVDRLGWQVALHLLQGGFGCGVGGGGGGAAGAERVRSSPAGRCAAGVVAGPRAHPRPPSRPPQHQAAPCAAA
jgi:hypothetical protein